MRKGFLRLVFGVGLFVLFFFASQAQAQTIAAPIISEIDGQNFSVSGLAPRDKEILIYIDKKWVGRMAESEPLDDAHETFFYVSDTPWSVGAHHIIVVAKDPTSLVLSPPSAEMIFTVEAATVPAVPAEEVIIEQPLPAPTLFSPVVNSQTSANRPFIVGLAKNNSNVRVFIDGKLDGEFKVKNHKSGTANFAYLPKEQLTKGKYLIYTAAIDDNGKESIQSNVIYYSFKQPEIAQAVEEDRQDAVSQIDEKKPDKISQPVVISEENGSVKKGKVEVVDIKTGEEAEAIGAINENKVRQSKLRFDILAFLLFFVGVLGWLFWVNRELIKEKRAYNQLTDLSKDKDNNQQNKLL